MSKSKKAITPLDKSLKEIAPKFTHIRAEDSLKFAQEKAFMISHINKMWQLKLATPESLAQSLLSTASMGLSLNPIKGLCYLIPRKQRKQWDNESDADYKKNVPYICTATPSYKGLSHICQKSGAVLFIRAEVVFKGDVFEYFGPASQPRHVVTNFGARQEDQAIGVYAVAKLTSGDIMCEFIDRNTILKIRNMSEMPKGIMWNPAKLWTEGWKKSAIRRLTKTLPIQSEAFDNALGVMSTEDHSQLNAPDIIESEIINTISEDQQNQLHALLVDSAIEKPNDWLKKLATKYSLNDISELPEQYFNSAKDFLTMAIASRKTE